MKRHRLNSVFAVKSWMDILKAKFMHKNLNKFTLYAVLIFKHVGGRKKSGRPLTKKYETP